jgi:hypothetical protein
MTLVSRRPTPKRLVMYAIALLALGGLWYAFRPEKLFTSTQVNEAPPQALQNEPTPIYTGRFVGEVHKTSGRATVLKRADGSRLLKLTDFSTTDAQQGHVLLLNGQDPNSKEFTLTNAKVIDLGSLIGTQGDQSYQIPSTADLQSYNTVSIYSESLHANFGTASLEEF